MTERIPIDLSLSKATNTMPKSFVLFDSSGKRVIMALPPGKEVLQTIPAERNQFSTVLEDGTHVPMSIGRSSFVGLSADLPDGDIIVSGDVAKEIERMVGVGEIPPDKVVWTPDLGRHSLVMNSKFVFMGVKSVILVNGVV